MKRPVHVAAALLLATACAPAARPAASAPTPVPTPIASTPTPVIAGEGESIETAVHVLARTEAEGVDWENDWIWRHYGQFRKKSVGLATLAGRRYDAVAVELADHSERTIYFDITDFFGKK